MNGADTLVKSLVEEGVEYVFGYPGVAIAPVYNAILKTGINTVLVRQEQNAAHEASGYARITGKVGVACVTSGPGALNLVTGIATAFADSIPMVIITGQVYSHQIGSDVFQEADICGACESFLKFSYSVRRASDIPRIIKEAFHIANTGRKGPVLIDIPQDVQEKQVSGFAYPVNVNLRTYKPTVEGHAVQIKRVIRELQRAKRPIICAGGGVFLSGAQNEVRQFVEKYNIPLVTTMMGLGILPTEHSLCYGMVGNNGQKYGNRAMNEADLILMVGTRVADRSIKQPDLITENKILVHIDVDPAEIGKIAGPTVPLVGDIKAIFEEFNRQELTVDYDDWNDKLDGIKDDVINTKIRLKNDPTLPKKVFSSETTADPEEFIRKLSLAMDEDAIITVDVGQNQLFACQNYVVRKGRFLTSGGMGTMGYALPAAIGAQLAAPDKQVVALCGDGGFQMNMMELATAEYYHVPVKLVILKNNVLGLVRQHQHLKYKDRFSVIDLGSKPDLDKIAEAYHFEYMKITCDEEVDSVLKRFLKDRKTSCILEVDIDEHDVV